MLHRGRALEFDFFCIPHSAWPLFPSVYALMIEPMDQPMKTRIETESSGSANARAGASNFSPNRN
jgi:hypothetical protein